jgi:cytoskeleton protein RodZ
MSEAAPADGVSAGTLLRQAREQAGLHVATLAAHHKVTVQKLEALEEDRYDFVGDAVFVRGLASSICRTLKVDPQPVLQRLPQTASPRLVHDTERINAPFRAPGDGPSPGLLDSVSRPVVLAVGALLLGALVLLFLPMLQKGWETVGEMARPEPEAPAPGVGAPIAPPAPVGTPSMDATAPALTAAASLAMPAASASPMAVRPEAGASAPLAAAVPDAASGAVDPRSILVFRTRGESWVQVTDATGSTVLRRLMQAGESAGATGTPPLSVVIGSVNATEVQLRGKPYNLAPVSRDNVARFEVK